MSRKGWSDLAPDLLRDIAGRLHVATDFVCMHAVCKPWCNSRDLVTTNQFLPWLLVSTESSCPLKLRCIFISSSYRVLPPPFPRRTNWVCSADGATVGYLTVEGLRPTLHDPITGAATDLPLFLDMRWEENLRGILYGDGTTLLYEISSLAVAAGDRARFRAALLRPGEAYWTLVDMTIETTGKQGEFCTAYHGGRILVTADARMCRVIMPDSGGHMVVPRPWIPIEHGSSCCWKRYSYMLESHGELLWVSVEVLCYGYHGREHIVSVSVHALEETSAPEKMLWVRKEGRCLSDRVLFLGSPNSFAVDVSVLGGEGGFAYFVYCKRVFRLSLIDGELKLMEPLPQKWGNEKCTWRKPNLTITPIQEIIERKWEAQRLKEQQQRTAPITSPSRIFHIQRHYHHRFRVSVRNLSPKVKESELQHFFSKHGKVLSTDIICNKNTKTSQGILKMATMHVREDDALAALEELVFDGCTIEVSSVIKRYWRRRPRKAA